MTTAVRHKYFHFNDNNFINLRSNGFSSVYYIKSDEAVITNNMNQVGQLAT